MTPSRIMYDALGGTPIMVSNMIQLVMKKLKRLKLCLRDWNKETFQDIFDAITATSAELLHIQNRVASLGDSSALFEAEVECQVRLNGLLSQRHAHFMQKNRT
ncbi:hypothetical protein ACS0TY_030589 [Phlomoides rotata]